MHLIHMQHLLLRVVASIGLLARAFEGFAINRQMLTRGALATT
jgi:hypothetical protein